MALSWVETYTPYQSYHMLMPAIAEATRALHELKRNTDHETACIERRRDARIDTVKATIGPDRHTALYPACPR